MPPRGATEILSSTLSLSEAPITKHHYRELLRTFGQII